MEYPVNSATPSMWKSTLGVELEHQTTIKPEEIIVIVRLSRLFFYLEAKEQATKDFSHQRFLRWSMGVVNIVLCSYGSS